MPSYYPNYYDDDYQPIYRTAIIDGRELYYDMCHATMDISPCSPDNFFYIGQGEIHEINGVKQNFNELLHFWRRKQ